MAIFSLSACSGGSRADFTTSSAPVGASPQVPSGKTGATYTHPIYEALTSAQAQLLGADADANGIRDDVDTYIGQAFGATPLLQKAVSKYAKNMTAEMLNPTRLISEVESSKRLAAYDCASNEIDRLGLKDADEWNKTIAARILDTKDRMRAWQTWDVAQDNSASLSLEIDPCITAEL